MPRRSSPEVADAGVDYTSLRRGLELLQYLQDLGHSTARDIHDALDIPLSTVYRYIAVLKESGFAVDIDGALVASERMAEPWSNSSALVRWSAPALVSLRVATGMSSVLAVRVHTAALCLDVSYAHPKHRVSFRQGQMRGLTAGASALVLLAHAPQTVLAEVFSRPSREYTASSPSVDELRDSVDQIRQDGVAVSFGQTTPGMIGVGVPVMINGVCVASVSVVGEQSSTAWPAAGLVDALATAAREIQERAVART